MKTINLMRKVRKITLFAILGLLSAFSGMLNNVLMGDVFSFDSVDRALGTEALERSQGVTTDGESWIYSGKTSLIRIAFDNETVLAINKKAIPVQFAEAYGSAHIGGISYADGLIFAAIEDSKVWENPIVAIFDSLTLSFTGKFVRLPGKNSDSDHKLTRGVPWVVCDKENGLFYVGECRNTKELYAYSLYTLDYVKTIPIETSVDRIQGGEMYNGRLFVATNDATRAVYRISLTSGKVEKYFDRIMYQPKFIDNFGGEGEDITVLPMKDGTVFHALNIGALFVDSNLRHYKPNPAFDDSPEIIPDDEPEIQKPNVTYLDRYFIDVLSGTSYTVKTELHSEDMVLPITYAVNGNKSVVSMTLTSLFAQEMELPAFLSKAGEIKLINDGTNQILSFPGGYTILEGDGMEEVINLLKYEEVSQDIASMLQFNELKYRGYKQYNTYVTETYRNEEGTTYVFYFDSEGLAQWEVYDADSGEKMETRVIKLKAGSSADLFKYSGKQYTMEELENLMA